MTNLLDNPLSILSKRFDKAMEPEVGFEPTRTYVGGLQGPCNHHYATQAIAKVAVSHFIQFSKIRRSEIRILVI